MGVWRVPGRGNEQRLAHPVPHAPSTASSGDVTARSSGNRGSEAAETTESNSTKRIWHCGKCVACPFAVLLAQNRPTTDAQSCCAPRAVIVLPTLLVRAEYVCDRFSSVVFCLMRSLCTTSSRCLASLSSSRRTSSAFSPARIPWAHPVSTALTNEDVGVRRHTLRAHLPIEPRSCRVSWPARSSVW